MYDGGSFLHKMGLFSKNKPPSYQNKLKKVGQAHLPDLKKAY